MNDAFALLSNHIISEILKIGPPRPAHLDSISKISGSWAQIAGEQKKIFESTTSKLVLQYGECSNALEVINSLKITTVKFKNCSNDRCVDSAVFRTILQCPTVRSVFAEYCSFSDEVVARDASIEFAKKPGFLQFSGLQSFRDLIVRWRSVRFDDDGEEEDEDEEDDNEEEEDEEEYNLDALPEFGQILQHWLDMTTLPSHMMRFAFSTEGRGCGLTWFPQYGFNDEDGSCADGFILYERIHPKDENKRIQIYCLENWNGGEQIVEMSVVSVLASTAAEFGEYSRFECDQWGDISEGYCYRSFKDSDDDEES